MSVEAILAQYQKNEKPANSSKQADLKDYFTTFLPKGQNSKQMRIRVLPSLVEGETQFVEVYGHSIQVDGQWRKFMCPKHMKNEACPFCEAREALLATGKESDKELAKAYNAKKMYVVKVIDREFESDGPKFWRFNHDYKKTGILDKIVGLIGAGIGDFANPETGRDLMINISRDHLGKPVVSSIIHMESTPLSSNPVLAKEFLSCTRTWDEVFPIKSYDYLEMIVKGETPVWDKEAKKFVSKGSVENSKDLSSDEDFDSELTIGQDTSQSVAGSVPVITEKPEVAITNTSGEIDDLPF